MTPPALVLVDTDTGPDRRVHRTLQRLGKGTEVVDLRTTGGAPGVTAVWETLAVAATMAAAALAALPRLPRLAARLRGRIDARPHRGLRAAWRWLRRARRTSRALAARGGAHPPVVLANDLYCAVAATLVDWGPATRLVYDSHELQVHRHRKVGWLRVLVEAGLEQAVLRRVDRLLVANEALATVMADWYQMPPEVQVDPNDHYPARQPLVASADARPMLVYVGMGTAGRQLELLASPSVAEGFDVRLYLLGATLPAGLGAPHWTFGPVDYEDDLRAAQAAHRCLMWCCLDPQSLSYELATPNKFFQALALGIPVVANRGTYLARLVEQHGIGVVRDDGPLAALAPQVAGEAYGRWVEAVVRFRAAHAARTLRV